MSFFTYFWEFLKKDRLIQSLFILGWIFILLGLFILFYESGTKNDNFQQEERDLVFQKNTIISLESNKPLLRLAVSKMNLSARSYHRTIKLARTIADLESSKNIMPSHIAEALQYRPRLDTLY